MAFIKKSETATILVILQFITELKIIFEFDFSEEQKRPAAFKSELCSAPAWVTPAEALLENKTEAFLPDLISWRRNGIRWASGVCEKLKQK